MYPRTMQEARLLFLRLLPALAPSPPFFLLAPHVVVVPLLLSLPSSPNLFRLCAPPSLLIYFQVVTPSALPPWGKEGTGRKQRREDDADEEEEESGAGVVEEGGGMNMTGS